MIMVQINNFNKMYLFVITFDNFKIDMFDIFEIISIYELNSSV